MKPQGVSIIISTRNQENNIGKCIRSSLSQDWPAIEVIVVDDGSADNTLQIAKGFGKKVRIIENKGAGRVAGLNKAIKIAKHPYVCLSAGDIELEKAFVKKIMKFFDKDVAFVSPFTKTGGNSTIYRKGLIEKLGYFDERFNVLGSGFRDDTDMAFRMFDAGYRGILTYSAKIFHASDRERLKTLKEKVMYAQRRVNIHTIDPLLYRKHPARASEFFDIRLGFLRNPVADFKTATGLWHRSREFTLKSPQGVVLLRGDKAGSKVLIFLLGLAYVSLVKLARLYGSVKYWKLMI
ncbi:MAG: glycosyltransferase [Candidatus Aenigmarchaeota archaeon]|nr:glycosyltransferase [Candidatus Aenigmarchaeota archaeon]